jgi:hypothetical protein
MLAKQWEETQKVGKLKNWEIYLQIISINSLIDKGMLHSVGTKTRKKYPEKVT